MEIHKNYSLLKHNTFGIKVKADIFIEVNSVNEIHQVLSDKKHKNLPLLIIGEGSNILFTNDFKGIIISPKIKEIKIINETETNIDYLVGAGINWDDFVKYCCDKAYSGLENLSNIPGSVGSSPIQNIGAYGVEVKDLILFVEAFNIEKNKVEILQNSACKFEYRNSIFKNEVKGKFIILNVAFRLNKKFKPILHYGFLKQKVEEYGNPTIENIRKSVIEIRKQKLPDPEEIGNGGSFFKNPIISIELFNELKKLHPEIPSYPISNSQIKIAAGWLIEKCNWKGYRNGDAGVHKNQSLVLVNYGNATGSEILSIAKKIQGSVKEKFNIELIPEVNII